LGVDIIPLLFGFLQRITKEIIKLTRKREEAAFGELKRKNGFRGPGEPTFPPYNITALHVRSQLA
jgi:hypothetical protein